MKDWRYVPVGRNTWRLNQMQDSPEDEWIARIDNEPEEPERISGVAMLDCLSPTRRDIVYQYIWEGLPFREIGELHNFSKQAAWVHYKNALIILKENYPDLSSLIIEDD